VGADNGASEGQAGQDPEGDQPEHQNRDGGGPAPAAGCGDSAPDSGEGQATGEQATLTAANGASVLAALDDLRRMFTALGLEWGRSATVREKIAADLAYRLPASGAPLRYVVLTREEAETLIPANVVPSSGEI